MAEIARQIAVLEDLAGRASDAAGWAAVRRQAGACLRRLKPWRGHDRYAGIHGDLEAHGEELARRRAAAEAELRTLPPADRRRAERAVGLRLAVIGKGGAGKSVLSATLARLLARRGRRVLAVDLDTNPGLSWSLGLEGADLTLPEEATEPDDNSLYGWRLRSDLLARQAVERFAVPGPDGVAVVGLGKVGDPAKEAAKRTLMAVTQILEGFGEPGWDVIADLEAGPTTPFEGYHAFADHVAVVVGPAWRSALTARRLIPLIGEGRTATIVANRVGDEPDHPGLVPAVRIPFDPAVAAAERRGLAPLEACPDSPAIRAVEALADAYLDGGVPTTSPALEVRP